MIIGTEEKNFLLRCERMFKQGYTFTFEYVFLIDKEPTIYYQKNSVSSIKELLQQREKIKKLKKKFHFSPFNYLTTLNSP